MLQVPTIICPVLPGATVLKAKYLGTYLVTHIMCILFNFTTRASKSRPLRLYYKRRI